MNRAVTKSADSEPFATLSPEHVLQAAEQLGLDPDGRLFALNSYENRVYRVGRAEALPVVMKFYRPRRWSDAQILEEHAFAEELVAADIAVAAPMRIAGSTLTDCAGLRVGVFPLVVGTTPELDAPEARVMLGRTLARMHSCGAARRFTSRVALRGPALGERARHQVLESPLLPESCVARYERISDQLLDAIEMQWEQGEPASVRRLHGDCHLGNILWTVHGPLFVDLDDCQTGPAVQDLWMFLTGDADNQRREWSELSAGYEQFANFDYRELALSEALRASRMLNHAAWVVTRWDDPAFPRAFPWFSDTSFWDRYLNDLAEQIELVASPPLLSA
jgi:Ser/Thr protein kinase RdoA (MazF antagonist)